jgi:hypothetical protein
LIFDDSLFCDFLLITCYWSPGIDFRSPGINYWLLRKFYRSFELCFTRHNSVFNWKTFRVTLFLFFLINNSELFLKSKSAYNSYLVYLSDLFAIIRLQFWSWHIGNGKSSLIISFSEYLLIFLWCKASIHIPSVRYASQSILCICPEDPYLFYKNREWKCHLLWLIILLIYY